MAALLIWILYNPVQNDKGYYVFDDLKELEDYLNDQFAPSKPISSVTTLDNKVYTVVPDKLVPDNKGYTWITYANAATNPYLTYTDLSLVWDTGLGYAAKKYGPQVGKFLARKAVPFLAKGVSFTGKILLAKEVVEFAWNGTNELAKHLCPYDPELESFIYESTKHLYPKTLVSPAAPQILTKDDIRTEKNANKDLIYSMAVSDMTFDKCWYIKQLPNPQKVQIWVNMA